MDETVRMRKLDREGFNCSQIIVILGLEAQGKVNPDLVRSVEGLAGGLGDAGLLCGVLSGAACLIGLYAGRSDPKEKEDARLNPMLVEIGEWFRQEFEMRYGGIQCTTILAGNPKNKILRCPMILADTFAKVQEILDKNGIAFYPEVHD